MIKLFLKILFILKHYHDRYDTQEMSDKVVDFCLLALKFVPDWFAISEMIEKFDSTIFANDYIVFDDLDSDFVTFFSSDIGLNRIAVDNINLDDYYLDHLDPETINHVNL